VTLTEAGVVFTVRDTGIGIPAEKLDRIFEPFHQVDSSMTRPFGGTGLGLAICRELVALMNGTIRAESEVDHGSVFSATLPLRMAVPESPAVETPTGTKNSGHHRKILLVEDEPTIQDLVSSIMRQRGWDVTIAENGRQAITCWQEGVVNLILMDVQMPEMNGLEATRMIRQLEKEQGKRTCIFGLTAHARAEDQQECLAAGMDGVLTKPFRIDQLWQLIQNGPRNFKRD
jgi:CheY-like chemotaxis protein